MSNTRAITSAVNSSPATLATVSASCNSASRRPIRFSMTPSIRAGNVSQASFEPSIHCPCSSCCKLPRSCISRRSSTVKRGCPPVCWSNCCRKFSLNRFGWVSSKASTKARPSVCSSCARSSQMFPKWRFNSLRISARGCRSPSLPWATSSGR